MLTQVDNCHQWRTMKLQQGNCRTRKTPSMQYRFNLRSAYEYTLHIQYQTMLQTIHAQVRIRIYVIHTILDHVIEHQRIGQDPNYTFYNIVRQCYRIVCMYSLCALFVLYPLRHETTLIVKYKYNVVDNFVIKIFLTSKSLAKKILFLDKTSNYHGTFSLYFLYNSYI